MFGLGELLLESTNGMPILEYLFLLLGERNLLGRYIDLVLRYLKVVCWCINFYSSGCVLLNLNAGLIILNIKL
jgi:hypothetical protein